jgi:hypothetical protein
MEPLPQLIPDRFALTRTSLKPAAPLPFKERNPINADRLLIGPIEAIEGTPVIDIKPVVESADY